MDIVRRYTQLGAFAACILLATGCSQKTKPPADAPAVPVVKAPPPTPPSAAPTVIPPEFAWSPALSGKRLFLASGVVRWLSPRRADYGEGTYSTSVHLCQLRVGQPTNCGTALDLDPTEGGEFEPGKVSGVLAEKLAAKVNTSFEPAGTWLTGMELGFELQTSMDPAKQAVVRSIPGLVSLDLPGIPSGTTLSFDGKRTFSVSLNGASTSADIKLDGALKFAVPLNAFASTDGASVFVTWLLVDSTDSPGRTEWEIDVIAIAVPGKP